MLETSTNILLPDSMVLAPPATLVPQKVPDLPKEAKLGEGKENLAAKDDPATKA
jgi:hypothetical protein